MQLLHSSALPETLLVGILGLLCVRAIMYRAYSAAWSIAALTVGYGLFAYTLQAVALERLAFIAVCAPALIALGATRLISRL